MKKHMKLTTKNNSIITTYKKKIIIPGANEYH